MSATGSPNPTNNPSPPNKPLTSKQKSSAPPLTKEARSHANVICGCFEKNLKSIAEAVAEANQAESVLINHVNAALTALKQSGLEAPKPPKKFWQRQDFKVGLGTMLIGLAPTVGSVFTDYFESGGIALTKQPFNLWVFVVSIPATIFLSGAVLAIYGWMQSPEHHDK
jgi:hypothetical protein